jgi:hypothetical protein
VAKDPPVRLAFASPVSTRSSQAFGATKAGAQRGCARRDGAASRGAVDPWSRCGLVLGCAGLYRASTRPAAGVRTTQLSSTQKRDMRRRGGVLVPCNRKAWRDGRHTDSPWDVGECMDLGLSRSSAREGTVAQAHNPCTKVHGATADPTHGPRTATVALKSTRAQDLLPVGARQFCGAKAGIQARITGRRVTMSLEHHRKVTKGKGRIVRPRWCSRWVDGVGVAGLGKRASPVR